MISSSHLGASPLAFAIAFIALAACGGRAATTTAGAPHDQGSASAGDAATSAVAAGDDGGGGGDRTFGDGSSSDALPPVVVQNGPAPEDIGSGPLASGTCPVSLPAAGDACTVAGARCSYGNSASPDSGCRDWVACSGEVWVRQPQVSTTCTAFEPLCNADKPEDLRACRSDCHFDDGTVCSCGDGQAYCAKPTANPACPRFAPNQGTACASNARCAYGFTVGACGHAATYASCVGNVWITQGAHTCTD